MRVSAGCDASTAEASASARQATKAFDEALQVAAGSRPDFMQAGAVSLGLTLMHPLVSDPRPTGRGSYVKSMATYFISSPLSYAQWATGDWPARMGLIASALDGAVSRLPKTRFSNDERALVREIIEEARVQTVGVQPPRVEPVASVFVLRDAQGARTVRFDGSAEAGWAELKPEALASTVLDALSPVPGPSMFKTYRRDADVLAYREAWATGGAVVEHFGVCGERGETREHPVASAAQAARTLAALKREARADGYRPIPASRRATLVVEFEVSSQDVGAVGKRHELEDFLNEELGWLGLGHCDGGSIGGGTMEVFCPIVDYKLAERVLTPVLKRSKFADFARLYRQP